MAKNDNMLAILWMLNSKDKTTAKEIAQKLEINIRTVYRYIDALSVSGVPIVSDPGHHGGYYLLNQYKKAPLIFDMDEKKALLQAAVFAKEAGYPFSEDLDRATAKLKQYSSQKQESVLAHHLEGFEVINRAKQPLIQPILVQLEKAVGEVLSVEIIYRSSHNEQTKKRLIDPYGMLYWNNKWYTVAFCHMRNEVRSFRMDRILKLKTTQLTFERPKDFSPRDFFMKNLLPDLSGKEKLILFTVNGREEALDDFCIHWFLSYYLKERTKNQAIFCVEEEVMYRYVPYFLLPYGKAIQVVSPQSLKDRLVAVTGELMEHYKSSALEK